MSQTPPRLKFRWVITAAGVLVAGLLLMITVSLRSAQNPDSVKNGNPLPTPAVMNSAAALTTSQGKDEHKKSNLEKTKSDAAELAALAEKLRDELNKTSVNVLSLDVIHKTEEVEKLAKKIKGEANER